MRRYTNRLKYQLNRLNRGALVTYIHIIVNAIQLNGIAPNARRRHRIANYRTVLAIPADIDYLAIHQLHVIGGNQSGLSYIGRIGIIKIPNGTRYITSLFGLKELIEYFLR